MSKKGIASTKQSKSFDFQLKDFDDEKGIIRGYLSTFDNVDEGNDRVRKGAFNKTLQDKYEYKKAHNKKYLMPLLWQHKEVEPIGGYTDAKEDNIGLYIELEIDLDVQRGREAYSGLKKGYIFQQSMGYDTINAEYVKIDGKMVRDLIEVRLWEGSIVTFPMNEQAIVTDVKSIEGKKAICGNTSGSIGARDEAWDGSKAEKQIWEVAEKEDGSISSSIAKKYFMNVERDGSKKADYSYPFWYVGDDPHICVGAVKAIVGAIQGARGASAPDGLKGKVEKLYNRINKKYPDDPELVPPWKGKSMNKKTLLEHYNDEMCQDLLEDWQDVYLCALTSAVLDAFKIGDQPVNDISAALDDFKQLVLTKFVPEAIECNLSDYIEDNTENYSSVENTMQYGSESKPVYSYYMSSNNRRTRKSGKPISASNQQKIEDHVKSLKSMSRKANNAMRDHAKAMHDTADSLEDIAGDSQKSGRTISAATAKSIKDMAGIIHDHADTASSIMKEHTKAVQSAADDFASVIQGSEQAYGTDPGDPGDEQQEGKSVPPPQKARNAQERPSQEDTDFEADLSEAFKLLKSVKKRC